MTCMHPWLRQAAVVAVTMAGLVYGSGSASATLIASDQFIIGPNAYTAATPLKSQPAVGPSGGAIGFASTGYISGSGSTNYVSNTGGLYQNNPNNAGEVSFQGYTGDTLVHSVARSLLSVTPPSELWFSITVSQDGSSTPLTSPGFALAGFGNSVAPTFGPTSGNLQGLYFGFAHETGDSTSSPNSDLVIRCRDTMGATAGDFNLLGNGVSAASNTAFTIIARVDINAINGVGDALTYWVDPSDTSSIAALDRSSLTNNDGAAITTYSFQGNSQDLARLNFDAQNFGGGAKSANFGDPTVGTSLADVAPAVSLPEPGSAALALIGLATAGLATCRKRA